MIYIIGDVHGCYLTLLALINKLPHNAKIVMVGDLIDRGPNSRKVIQYIRDNNIDCVLGNHEELMIDCGGISLDDNLLATGWGGNGGDVCEREYEGDRISIEDDMEFLSSLPRYIVYEDYVDAQGRKLIVTHAPAIDYLDLFFKSKKELEDGLSEYEEIDRLDIVSNIEELMIWSRTIPKKGNIDFFNVFGHTPIDAFIFDRNNEFKIKEKYITPENIVINNKLGYANIDSGAVYTKKKHGKYRGKMTALEFPSLRVIQQENIDDCESY